MTDLHLVWSWSARGSLRGALRQWTNVMRADNAPDLGPLNDGRQRGTFFRELYQSVRMDTGELGEEDLPTNAFSEWATIKQEIAETVPERVLIWTSHSGADYVFLRMASHFLADCGTRLWQVHVKTGDHFCAVGSLPGETLLSFLPSAKMIDSGSIRRYADEFDAMAANPCLLRMATPDGRLTYHDLSFFDDAILGYCSFEWRRTIHVVDDTMGHADSLNPPSDLLIFSRLLHLVRAGALELDGEFSSIYEDGFRRCCVRTR